MSKQFPRTLVISHNAFSLTLNNGKTLSNIFKGWNKDSIAQLYFQNEIPNFSVCSNFFCITDENMLLKKKEEVGNRILFENLKTIKKSNTPIHTYARKKPLSLFGTCRNIIWKSKKWNNEKLHNWLDEFNPQVIFLVGGIATFPYEIANYISDRYSIPIYLYYTDDYITPIKTIDMFWWINLFTLRKQIKKIINRIPSIFVIGEEMGKEYEVTLGKKCIPIMNSVEVDKYKLDNSVINENNSVINENNSEIKLAYFGGLHLNRWKSIVEISKSIERICKEQDININLSIYSSNKLDEDIINKINNNHYSKYMGSVDSDKIILEMQKYDILVHVESFEKKMKSKTRLSISTKIPEYLATGKPILAMGPSDIASIKYLKELNISYIIDEIKEENIDEVLNQIILQKNLYKEIGIKGIEIAKKRHSLKANQITIYETLSSVVNNM